MTKKICFFSRDERTHRLFRDSWHLAAQKLGAEAFVVCRGFGLLKSLFAIFSFISRVRFRRIVFGTSEICLYCLFSGKNDVWVFTGLGRLLIDETVFSKFVIFLLRVSYCGQLMIVLNDADRNVIFKIIGTSPALLDGEGYCFSSSVIAKKNSSSLCFAYVGRLLRSKGVDDLVACFARHSRPNWSLLLIGDNDFSNSDSISHAEFQVLKKTSLGSIDFLGFRSDVRQLLFEVDVLVSLSRREGLPFSVLDGIDAGAHLVLSPVPGHLSFRGLPGVTFTEADQMGKLFEEISSNPDSFLNFDRGFRISYCERKFGQRRIVSAIQELLNINSSH